MWSAMRLPTQERRVDRVMDIGQREAEETMRALARTEGIFAGVVCKLMLPFRFTLPFRSATCMHSAAFAPGPMLTYLSGGSCAQVLSFYKERG